MDIGKKIRKVRELKGYTQDYMATQLKISQAAYSRLEQNEKIGFDKIKTITDILDINPIDLISFDDNLIFNNTNQKGGNAASIMIHSMSENERSLYEQRISHLEQEVEFLRSQLNN